VSLVCDVSQNFIIIMIEKVLLELKMIDKREEQIFHTAQGRRLASLVLDNDSTSSGPTNKPRVGPKPLRLATKEC
jgi:hypothetical protein